jgi:integrase
MARKSTRAAQGSGTIRQRSDGRWEARYTVGRDPGTGKQIQRSVYGATQQEVRKKLAQVTTDIDGGTYKEPCKMTLSQWLDIWSTEYLGGVKPKTVESYCCQIKIHIKPALGAVKLETLNTHMIQKFYNSLSKERNGKPGLSPKSIKIVHGVLHKALQQAVSIGYIKFNPSDACTIPRVERKEIKPLDNEAIIKFLKAIQGHRFEDVYLTLLFTGMRRGEVCGLTWDHVNLEKGTILINRQLQNIPGQPGAFRLVSTKSSKGRTISVAASVVEILKKHRAKQAEARLLAGPIWKDENFVFTDDVGSHLSPNTLYHNYKRLVASIGMPDARLHDLRHSYAVAALRAGDDIKTVQGNLGHHTASFTLDTYGHVTEEMKQASADRMNSFIKSISNL